MPWPPRTKGVRRGHLPCALSTAFVRRRFEEESAVFVTAKEERRAACCLRAAAAPKAFAGETRARVVALSEVAEASRVVQRKERADAAMAYRAWKVDKRLPNLVLAVANPLLGEPSSRSAIRLQEHTVGGLVVAGQAGAGGVACVC